MRGDGSGSGSQVRDPDGFGGLILAMDTSGRRGSAAVAAPVGEDPRRLEVLSRVFLRAEEEHASLLIPRIRALLEEIGADREELAGIVVGAGPGSFTGVRVGAATAKGVSRALRLPLWVFSSLAAAAMADGSSRGVPFEGHPAWGGEGETGRLSSDFDTIRPRCVLFDARGDRVYAAAYRLSMGRVETLLAPCATTLTEVLDGLVPPGALLLGDGALRNRAILEEAGHPVLPPPFGEPSADGLIRLLALSPDEPPLDAPERWEPQYLRASGAERMWKTRRGMGR